MDNNLEWGLFSLGSTYSELVFCVQTNETGKNLEETAVGNVRYGSKERPTIVHAVES